MHRLPVLPIALFTAILLFFSCGKESSEEQPIEDNGTLPSGTYGWALSGNDTANFLGCIDTAFYTAGPVRVLTVSGTDPEGNTFELTLMGTSLATGTYSSTQGTATLFVETATDIYTPGIAFPFTVNVTTLNDTLIVASLSGQLESFGGTETLRIEGELRALIGKINPCGTNPGNGGGNGGGGNGGGGNGGGGGGGGGTGNAVYELSSVGGDCFSSDVLGDYIRGVALTATNKVELQVDVFTAGTWSITTSLINGIKFTGSGTFPSTGAFTITLNSTGTPTVYGDNIFPVTAGSSSCSFIVPVDTVAIAPCDPTNNTCSMQGVNTFNITFVSSQVFGGDYRITANGTSGDVRFEFAGTTAPAPGDYDIVHSLGDLRHGKVMVDVTTSNIFWTPRTDGKVYVTVANGKATMVTCALPMIGSLGGPAFNSAATIKVTER